MPSEGALVRVERRDHALVIGVQVARFDSENAPKIRAAIEAAVSQVRDAAVALDLSAVEFLGSAGLGVLVNLNSLFRSKGRRFAVCGAQDDPARVIRAGWLDRIFELAPSVDDFLARLTEGPTKAQP